MIRISRRILALGSIAGLLFLLMAPNLVWFAHVQGPMAWVQALIVPAFLLLLLFALLGRSIWLACLLLSPFALLAPLEIFFVARYRHPTSSEVIATLFATNPREAREYLGATLLPLLLIMALAFALALLAAWSAWRSGWSWRGRPREWILAIAIVAPLATLATSLASARGDINSRTTTALLTLSSLAQPVEPGYPFGVPLRLLDYRRQWIAMRNSAAKLKNFRFGAKRTNVVHRREVYVLVIGESSRRDHWELFGYSRATTPELASMQNLIAIPHMLTSWPESITAIPHLLTRKPITSASAEFGEASILRAMQESGFTTYWISNQLPIGKFDSPVARYAYEADHVEWLNHATWSAPGSYDEDLVQPLRDALKNSDHDLFIVLHMMGSHLGYDFRYPSAFKQFVPTYSDHDNSKPRAERLRNSYDNTVLYTDHVLARIIEVLRRSDAVTALWFESDHGETLPTPTCDQTGHGIGTRYDFQVPAFFWYSDAYAALYPQRIAAIRGNADKRTLSSDTFESLADMTGTTFPGHDESWSLFSPAWRYRPRIVNLLWQTDYDKSTFGKGCEIVLPPKDSISSK